MKTNMISEKQAAELLSVCPATIRTWRHNGYIDNTIYEERQYVKIMRVKYDKQKLVLWAKEKGIYFSDLITDLTICLNSDL